MTTPSKAAKAASVLAYTSGISDTNKAVELYDAVAESEDRISSVLDKFPEAQVWDRLGDLTEVQWWDEVCMLADSIDKAIAYFKEH